MLQKRDNTSGVGINNCERSEPPSLRIARAVYIYIYILVNATALGSRIPPHAVLLQVNDNTPVKLKFIFAI